MLHSGTIYPTEDRDPTPFFDAIARLLQEKTIARQQLRVVLRATGYDEIFRKLIQERDLEDVVELAPSIPYLEALSEMLTADGLLLFQGYTSNPAIPAKAYEYFRARRPIFALVDDNGSTARLLSSLGIGTLAAIDDTRQIAEKLASFLNGIRSEPTTHEPNRKIEQFSRFNLTSQLASLFDSLSNAGGNANRDSTIVATSTQVNSPSP